MRHALSLCLLALSVFATQITNAAVYRVGAVADADCTHTSIQDALNAAAVDPGSLDTIYVAANQTYSGQALTIDHQSVLVYGGTAQCADNSASGPATVLDGIGNGGLPVVDINLSGGPGYLVSLSNLDLRHGNVGAGDGGNLRVRGTGQVSLSGLLMRDGAAGRGGGLYAVGDDATHRINLQIGHSELAPTTAEGNQAGADGGGIYCDQHCFLGISSIRVADNDAQRGGGIFMAAQSSMSFAAGGLVHDVETGILGNRASLDGGGLYADTGSSPSTARYQQENDPPLFANNLAGRDGGGIYLTGTGTYLLGYNLQLTGNVSGTTQPGRGGGLYVGATAGVFLSEDNDSVHCGVASPCVSITGNDAGLFGNSGTGGGIFVDSGSTASVGFAMFSGNDADDGAAAAVQGNGAGLFIRNSILTDNTGLHSLLVAGSSQAQLSGITVTGEASTDALILLSFASLELHTSIIHDPGTTVLALTGPTTITSSCVLSHVDFHTDGDVRVGDPDFVDAASGDFRLGNNSDALDACAASVFAAGDPDYSESPRGLDLPEVPDLGGPFDLGAFERELPPEVFADGFEAT